MNYNALQENTLLGIGHPLLDLLANVDEDFLRKYNLKKNKTIAATESHDPLFRDLIENYNPICLVGGCIHNALYVTQWIIEKPKVATFIGCVGDDEYAEIVEKEAQKVGIDVRFEKLESKSTSSCAVLITGTHRTLVTRIGTSNYYSEEHVKKSWPCVERAQFFYIMGFSLPMNFDFTLQVAIHSEENKKKFIMNLSAEYICKRYTKEFMEVFPYIDIIFGNEFEAIAFAAALNLKSKDFKAICLDISNLPKRNKETKRICIITRTEKPIVYAIGNEVKEFPVVLVCQEKIIDTNGAGDAFVGGFLSQLITGRSIEECIKCGLWAASVSLQHIGCNFDDKWKYVK
ncbi:adenosine kinase-like [Coccinella septempunctata]|uniref:adenosine kinase-like n=1 Tax=Coccinella septempunctata TaxID=41139 RepID=UPI001D066AED|nr:adenosine kinase-like [Coccinella septempunctata]